MSGLIAKGLEVRLPSGPAIGPVDLAVRPGELLGLIGPNGAGKSTLVRAIAGLIPCECAGLSLGGRDLGAMSAKERARRIGYLPQGGRVHWPLSVRRLVALGRHPHGRNAGAGRGAETEHALEAAGLGPLAERSVLSLSGGELSRALLARVLAGQPDVILADEPAASLDPLYQLLMLEALKAEAGKGRAVLIVLHDLSLAARFCDRLVLLAHGRVQAEGSPAEVLAGTAAANAFSVELARFNLEGREVFMALKAAARAL